MQKFNQFREQYPIFVYHGYETEVSSDLFKIQYHFEIEGLAEFHLEWLFKLDENYNFEDKTLIDNLVFSLGLVELVSYWKATCSPKVVIKPHGISSEMIKWWKSLYFNGLGEFFYTNSIKTDLDSFMEIICDKDVILPSKNERALSGALVPVGGGKDSAVTLKVLNKLKEQIKPYIINGRGATQLTCEAAHYYDSDVVTVKRTIDKNLIDLNSKGFLNGHTPFSAIVAFSSILAAIFNSKEYVIL